ncbi:FecR protein [Planctomycetes bacterium Pan216]|uniref:FecR protein n=1 Tax=Kolteria novifilia TaxID=2527975 RepID=A0A518B8M7_9BACT|nr:FecR protein [Planctomycetes bacterium Pan216]
MTPSERQRLIDALLEHEISEADFLRLEAELSVDPEARRDYLARVSLSLLLENEAAAIPPSSTNDVPKPTDSSRAGWTWRRAFVGMAAIAASLLVMLWLSTGVPGPDAPQRQTPSLASDHGESHERTIEGFAIVSGQSDAVWDEDRTLANGSLVPAGELRLRAGLVQLELFSGVQLVVEGDARFAIRSPMEVVVIRGKVRARVPEPARGFRLRTEAGEVVDLGTEFAVNVTDEGSDVHVLDGEIEWQARGHDKRVMHQGQSAATSVAGDERTIRSTSDDFVGPNELRERLQATKESRLRRWREHSEERRADPRLSAFYQVGASDLSDRRLANRVTNSERESGEGAVVAAALAPDRFGRPNGALDFSPTGSRVRLSVPGEHRSMTLLCWVKINSLDRWYNSLFLTDGHEQGEPHWQIMDDGRLFFSVKKRDKFDRSKGERDKHVYFSPPFWTSELSGQWLMIATVYDVDRRQVTHYLNGEVLSEEAIPEEYLVETVRIGNASICNWDLPKRDEPRFAVRNLNGSLDEFALYDAALSPEEIKDLYDHGKP